MKVSPNPAAPLGVLVDGFDHETASDDDVATLKRIVYEQRIAIIRGQRLDAHQYLALGKRFGDVEAYYQPMYHHPQVKEVFVSSNVAENDETVGVPRTGGFWHADYEFMPRPFAFTFVHQRVVPKGPRGTYFLDLTKAWAQLPTELKAELAGSVAVHSPRRYFKIRPSDVYRPISELLDEVDRETPPVRHPAVIRHPVDGREMLFVSEGLTCALETADGELLPAILLQRVFEATGQLDTPRGSDHIHLQTYEANDLVMWDNRALVHRALHTPVPEPTVTWRITVHDGLPLSGSAALH